MKIILMNTSFPPMARSAGHLFYDLGRNLVARGHQVSIVTELPWRRMSYDDSTNKYKRARFWLRERIGGMNVLRVRGFPFKEGSLIGRGINALLLPLTFYLGARSLGDVDVILVYSPPLTLGLAAFLLKRFHRIPFLFNVQDIYPQTLIELGLMTHPLLIKLFEWIERFTYNHTSFIVVHSEGNRQYIIKRRPVDPDKVRVIHNWVDANFIKPSERINDFRAKQGIGSQFLVCYAGTMGHAQDLNPIIWAAKQLQKYNDILFFLIGEGVRESEWRQLVETRQLNNVRFLSLQPKDVYTSIINAANVGMVPLIEDLRTPVVPGKLMDFMAGARPVIATVNLDGDTARIINEAKCGFAYAPDNGKEVTNAILKLYKDQSLGNEMGKNGRTYAEEHFSLNMCASKYEALFEQLLSK